MNKGERNIKVPTGVQSMAELGSEIVGYINHRRQVMPTVRAERRVRGGFLDSLTVSNPSAGRGERLKRNIGRVGEAVITEVSVLFHANPGENWNVTRPQGKYK